MHDGMTAATRLAAYGTLAPGRVNHHQLAGLRGHWIEGSVRGRLVEAGWGATFGFPGLILDQDGVIVKVQVFESSDLPVHWARLDQFEGIGYRRAIVQVSTPDGGIESSIYVVNEADS